MWPYRTGGHAHNGRLERGERIDNVGHWNRATSGDTLTIRAVVFVRSLWITADPETTQDATVFVVFSLF